MLSTAQIWLSLVQSARTTGDNRRSRSNRSASSCGQSLIMTYQDAADDSLERPAPVSHNLSGRASRNQASTPQVVSAFKPLEARSGSCIGSSAVPTSLWLPSAPNGARARSRQLEGSLDPSRVEAKPHAWPCIAVSTDKSDLAIVSQAQLGSIDHIAQRRKWQTLNRIARFTSLRLDCVYAVL